MISIAAAMMLQAMAPAAPPPPPPPPPRRLAPARAKANLGALVGERDYPSEALRKNAEGVVGFRLEVGADGRVRGCRVISSSGSGLLDSTTCRIMSARARFTAARDSNGAPTTDTVTARIVWRLQSDFGLYEFEPSLAVETIRATPNGTVKCQVVVTGDPPEAEVCPADLADPMGAMARKAGRVIEQTIVTILTPAGGVELADTGSHGTLLAESDAALRIAADGSIAECRVTWSNLRGRAALIGSAPLACDPFAPGPRAQFVAAEDSAAQRSATVKVRVYGRR